MENQIVLSIGNILTALGGFGVIFGAFYKLLSKKFDALENKFDKKFELSDKKFDKIGEDIKELRNALTSFEKNTEHRFGKIETRLSVMENEQKNTNQRLSNIEGHLVPKKVFHFEEAENERPKEN